MSYNSSTGVIGVKNISIDDVYTALGESSYDLGTLCISDKINFLSICKPTATAGIDPDKWYEGKSANDGVETDWYKGVNCYGFSKPSIWEPTSFCNTPINGPALLASNPFSTLQNEWTKVRPSSWYRLTDFANYCHKTQTYKTLNNSYPFSITASITLNGVAMNVNVQIALQKEDALLSRANNNIGSLGFTKLFNLDENAYKDRAIYIGAVVIPVDGSHSVCLLATGDNIRNVTSSTTGLTFVYNVGATVGDVFGGSKTSPQAGKFYSGERVRIVPVLVLSSINSTGLEGYTYMSLKAPWISAYPVVDLGDVYNSLDPMTVSSLSGTLSCLRDGDGYYVFYFKNLNNFIFKVTHSTATKGFLYNRNTYIGVGDGNTYIYEIKETHIDGTTNTEEAGSGWYKSSNQFTKDVSNNMSYLANNSIQGTYAIPRLRVSSSVTSFKIVIAMDFLKKNGVIGIKQATVTVDVSGLVAGDGQIYDFAFSS